MKQVTIPVSKLSLVMLLNHYGATDVFRVRSTDTYRNRLLYSSDRKADLRKASKMKKALLAQATFEVSNQMWEEIDKRDAVYLGWAMHIEDWQTINSFLLGQVSLGVCIEQAVFNMYKIYRLEEETLKMETVTKNFWRWRKRKNEKNIHDVIINQPTSKERFDNNFNNKLLHKTTLLEFDFALVEDFVKKFFGLDKSLFYKKGKDKVFSVPRHTYIYIMYEIVGHNQYEIEEYTNIHVSNVCRMLQNSRKWINERDLKGGRMMRCVAGLFEKLEERQSLSYEIARQYIGTGMDAR